MTRLARYVTIAVTCFAFLQACGGPQEPHDPTDKEAPLLDPTLDPLADQRFVPIVGPALFTPPVEGIYLGDFVTTEDDLNSNAVVNGVPWASQAPPYTLSTSANCGPTSYLMVEAFHNGFSLTEENTESKIRAAVDWLAANVAGYAPPWKPGIAYYNGDETGPWILTQLAKGRGFANATYGEAASMEILKLELAAGRPVIVRIHYQSSKNTSNQMWLNPEFGHFAVVVGMDAQYIYLNDPGAKWERRDAGTGFNYGASRRYTLESFREVWADGANGMRNAAVFVPPSGAPSPVGIAKASTALPDAGIGAAYSATLSAHGGVRPYTWSVSNGDPAPGLDVSDDGQISGTPSRTGTYRFTVRVEDDAGSTAEAEVELTVSDTPVKDVSILTLPLLPSGQVGQEYRVQLSAGGGVGPHSWSLSSGSVPPGTSLSPSGEVMGVPSSAGTYKFAALARESGPTSDEREFTILVLPGAAEQADLVVDNLNVTPAVAQPGTSVSVTFDIANLGLGEAGSSTTRIRINSNPTSVTTSDRLLKELATPGLAGGQSQHVSEVVTVPSDLADGSYYVWVTADVFNEAGQANYDNDRARVQLRLGQVSGACEDPAATVHIPDPTLAAGIRSELGLEPQEDITCEAIGGLLRLTIHGFDLADDQRIKSLEGIQSAGQIHTLILSDHEITDLTPLSALDELLYLRLGNGTTWIDRPLALKLGDLSPLSHMTGLLDLDLSGNHITGIGALAPLTELTVLDLGRNDLSDVSVLAHMPDLRFLNIRDNEISDISALADKLQLEDLLIDGNQIVDLSPLEPSIDLSRLWAGENDIADISALAGMVNMQDLLVERNRISDLSPLSAMSELETLWAQDNEIANVEPLGGLANLRWLELGSNAIEDLSTLTDLPGLESLGLGWNQIYDITPLGGLVGIDSLWLDGNYISDVSTLANLTELTDLGLGNNRIEDISALAGLGALTYLSLYGNRIGDIGPLVANLGIGESDEVNVGRNCLDLTDETGDMADINALISRGVLLLYDSQSVCD